MKLKCTNDFHDNIRNMAVVRACVYIFVIVLCFHVTIAKPMFGLFWCELACLEDDDEITTTPRSRDMDVDDLFCGHCPPRRRRPNPNVLLPGNPAVPQPAIDPRFPNRVNVNMWPANAPWGPWVWAPGTQPVAAAATAAPTAQSAPITSNPQLVAPLAAK